MEAGSVVLVIVVSHREVVERERKRGRTEEMGLPARRSSLRRVNLRIEGQGSVHILFP